MVKNLKLDELQKESLIKLAEEAFYHHVRDLSDVSLVLILDGTTKNWVYAGGLIDLSGWVEDEDWEQALESQCCALDPSEAWRYKDR